MPRQWNKLLLAGCAAVVGIVFCLFITRENEPSYDGRMLSEWITVFSATNRAEDFARATNALRNIGAQNAVPFLLRWSNYEPSRFKRSVWQLLPNSIGHTKRAEKLLLANARANERAEYATRAFAAFGSLATSAIPELRRRVAATNDTIRRLRAFQALGAIGLPAAPVLLQSVTNFEADWAVVVMAALGTNAPLAIPVLNEKCTNDDATIRRRATNLLGMYTQGDATRGQPAQ